jgi:hypothetical protein
MLHGAVLILTRSTEVAHLTQEKELKIKEKFTKIKIYLTVAQLSFKLFFLYLFFYASPIICLLDVLKCPFARK